MRFFIVENTIIFTYNFRCTRAEVGGILTDFQIDLELEELSTTKSHIINFVVDEESLEEYEECLNDLREQIDSISAQYDSLDRLIDHGLLVFSPNLRLQKGITFVIWGKN